MTDELKIQALIPVTDGILQYSDEQRQIWADLDAAWLERERKANQ